VLALHGKGIDARVLADGVRGFQATGRPFTTGGNP